MGRVDKKAKIEEETSTSMVFNAMESNKAKREIAQSQAIAYVEGLKTDEEVREVKSQSESIKVELEQMLGMIQGGFSSVEDVVFVLTTLPKYRPSSKRVFDMLLSHKDEEEFLLSLSISFCKMNTDDTPIFYGQAVSTIFDELKYYKAVDWECSKRLFVKAESRPSFGKANLFQLTKKV